MTIQDALSHASQQLDHIEESNLIIYSLISHALNLSKEHIWAHPDIQVTQDQFAQFNSYVDRAANHEPLAYIIGEKEFYNLPFYVTQDTLIPRPESEKIIEISKVFIKKLLVAYKHTPNIVDVGTGSGCLAITIASLFPQANVYAVDISSEALEVAKRNAARHSVSNVTFLQGSLLEPLKELAHNNKIDLIVANLPYISNDEYEVLPLNVRQFEPVLALKSGADPDVLNRHLIHQSVNWLAPHGKLVYETTNGRVVELDH